MVLIIYKPLIPFYDTELLIVFTGKPCLFHYTADSVAVSTSSAPGSCHGLGFIIWQDNKTEGINATSLD